MVLGYNVEIIPKGLIKEGLSILHDNINNIAIVIAKAKFRH